MNRKMKNKIYIIVLIFLGAMSSGKAQDLTSHYGYLLNQYNINPAYGGASAMGSAMLNYRNLLSGFDQGPRNVMFGVETPLDDKMGVGCRMISDSRGAFKTLTIEGSYSYQVYLSSTQTLRFGISAGVLNQRLDTDGNAINEFTNPNDPNLSSGYFNRYRMVSGLGLLYRNKGFEFALSSPHLFIQQQPLARHHFAQLSYKLDLEHEVSLRPAVTVQTFPGAPARFDFGVQVTYRNMLWIQPVYKSNNSMMLAAGIQYHQWSAGYAYGMGNSFINEFADGAHEVMVAWKFDLHKKPSSRQRRKMAIRELNNMQSRIGEIISGDRTAKLQDVKEEVRRLNSELDELLKDNVDITQPDISEKISEIHSMINQLLKKYSNKN